MSVLRMAWRYIWTRPLVTILTIIGVTLGSMLVCGVLLLHRETEKTFLHKSALFDLVVGAKGSPLQLVLSSIYHLDIPTGNIPYSRFEALRDDPRVLTAVPIGLGDNYRGYRIVGTTDVLFSLRRGRGTESDPLFRLQEGRFFESDFEAVLGNQVAEDTGLGLGDTFVGTHGLVVLAGSEEHEAFPYTVSGILEANGTSSDRAILTTLSSVWKVHDEEEETHAALFGVDAPKPTPAEREVTAVLLRLKAVGLRLWMVQEIKEKTESMAAVPVNEMLRLYRQVLAPMQRTLLGVAGLVVVVSSLSIAATLYQSTERRRRDLAILRALGAHPREMFFLVLMEAFFLTGLGVLSGWLTAHGIVALIGFQIRKLTGLAISAWSFDGVEAAALLVILAMGLLAGLVPAFMNYRRSPLKDIV